MFIAFNAVDTFFSLKHMYVLSLRSWIVVNLLLLCIQMFIGGNVVDIFIM